MSRFYISSLSVFALRVGLLSALLIPFASTEAEAFTIDTFDDTQSLSVGAPGDAVAPTGTDSSTAFDTDNASDDFVGEERVIETTVTDNSQDVALAVDIGGGDYTFSSPFGLVGSTTLSYFGAGGSSLGGIDLTDGGPSDTFTIELLSANLGANFSITVGDGTTTDTVTALTPFPVIPGTNSPQSLNVGFDAFDPLIDFTSVEVLSLTLEPQFTVGTDIELSLFETNDLLPNPEPPTGVPEPATLLGLGLLAGGLLINKRRQITI